MTEKEEPRWRGWARDDGTHEEEELEFLYVGPIPLRKRIALYRECGMEGRLYGYFVDEEAAVEFMAHLGRLLEKGET